MQALLALIGIGIGAVIGVDFADIDQQFPDGLLRHRSLITHGSLIPLLLAAIATLIPISIVRGFTIGFCVTNAVHLSFDLFPKAWQGYALIHVFNVSISPIFSWLWIALGIVVSLLIVFWLQRNLVDLIASVVSLIFGVISHADEGMIFPTIALLVGIAIAFSLLPPKYLKI